jgi:hypothetical protein
MQRETMLSLTKQCLDCGLVKPATAYQKTKRGTGRADRCHDCIEVRAVQARIEQQRKRDALDDEIMAFLDEEEKQRKHFEEVRRSLAGMEEGPRKEEVKLELRAHEDRRRLIPGQLITQFNSWSRGGVWKPKPIRRSNRPHMKECRGCGDLVPKLDFYEYRGGGRSNYCKPCVKRRAVERDCVDCGSTLETKHFIADLHVSPHCPDCREKRTKERRCHACDTVKPLADFYADRYGRHSGHCRDCHRAKARIRSAARRAEAKEFSTP